MFPVNLLAKQIFELIAFKQGTTFLLQMYIYVMEWNEEETRIFFASYRTRGQ